MIPLADTLTALLPTREQSLFLRAACGGPEAAAAWAEWCATVGDRKQALQTQRAGTKRLLPLLFHSLRALSVPIDPELAPYLRAAYAREELRARSSLQAAGDVLDHLARAGIEPLVLRGPALACTVYAEPALRHSHDLDLLLEAPIPESAARALMHSGCREMPADPVSGAPILEHPSGLRIQLHDRLIRLNVWRAAPSPLRARSHVIDAAGTAVRTLSPADHLVHVCAQAACTPSRLTLQWACDAEHLVRGGGIDWDVVVELAAETGAGLPLLTLLSYLENDLQAAIPKPVLKRIEQTAGRADRADRDAALFAARAAGTTFRALLAHSRCWPSRLLVLAWMALPSPAYLRQARGVRKHSLLTYYGSRPLRYVWRRWDPKRLRQ